MPSSFEMAGGGLRLQLFAALAIAVIAAASTAAVVAYHVFDRELDRALEARLQMLVAETGRVMDAGIAAGLELDRPQLQERAIRNLRANPAADEVIAVVDSAGRIVASSNPAEIGELVPIETLATPALGAAGDSAERTVAVRPIGPPATIAASSAWRCDWSTASFIGSRIGPNGWRCAPARPSARFSTRRSPGPFARTRLPSTSRRWPPW